jgi:hypothetical protein
LPHESQWNALHEINEILERKDLNDKQAMILGDNAMRFHNLSLRFPLAASLLLLIVGCGVFLCFFPDPSDTCGYCETWPSNLHAGFCASQLPALGGSFESFPVHNRERRTSTCKVVMIEEIFSRRVFSLPEPLG